MSCDGWFSNVKMLIVSGNAGLFVVLALNAVTVFSEILTPPYFNLAENRNITASATCGVDTEGPELYCKLVGAVTENEKNPNVNLIQGQSCDVCDITKPEKSHPPELAIDGKETWWQSPPLSRGMRYNEVNLTIDLGQEFHVAYVFIRMGNSPRPGLWVLEKSADYGLTYTPWQYFSDSPADCEKFFGRESLQPINRDDSVICSTEYSKIVPLEGGEIPISLLNSRPSANHYFNSSVLQEWTRATNVRLRLLRTKNFLGHLMSVARQDPTVTRRYFYSIKDISIGGRCMCNGHADTCYRNGTDPRYVCQCRHNTCGAKCETCCPGFEQKAWRQSKHYKPFICEPCNCFQHSNECTYDPEVDKKGLSLDIHGKYEGGGVCQNCQHNTEGINCNKCKPKFYRPYSKQWNETDVCHHCHCDKFYSTGNCAEGSGKCECKPQYKPPDCDVCSEGYYRHPDCIPCDCNLNGTVDRQCEAKDGRCTCKENFGGPQCKECADTYYGYPECKPCECNLYGMESDVCNKTTGNCLCKQNHGGKKCDQCKDGFYAYPSCSYCNCDIKGTKEGICDKDTGSCFCKEGYTGEKCDQCISGYYGYPDCKPCNCSTVGSHATTCDATGNCRCMSNFAGRTCDQCRPGFYKFPECLDCKCDTRGSNGITCNNEGKCECRYNFDGNRCEICKEEFYNFPSCEACNCNPAGVVAQFAGCGSVPVGELCKCKERVEGRICDKCKPFYWNLNLYNPDGCEECKCHKSGVLGGLSVCNSDDGQCVCKPSVVARDCKECADGTYNLTSSNLFGCVDCGCDIGGSTSRVCDKSTGQCPCQIRVTGRTCKEPIKAHYFPTLYQYQYEVEDGHTPTGTQVKFDYDETIFPDYSWKGYAVFTHIRNEILQDIYIEKPSFYRMVLRYVNRNADTVKGYVKIIPDNPNDNEQKLEVVFKSTTSPSFVTLSGSTPLVMDPGKWTVSIHIDRNLLLDYFVLLPEEFYSASILNEVVETPCTISDEGLCRQYAYINVTKFSQAKGLGGFTPTGGSVNNFYTDEDHLKKLDLSRIPVLDDNQPKITYSLTVPKPGKYVIVINYFSTRYAPATQKAFVEIASSKNNETSRIDLYSCPYTTVCRVAVSNGELTVHDTHESNMLNVTLWGNGISIGLESVVAIPWEEWSLDYIQPTPVCIRKDGVCIESHYPEPPESKKIQIEQDRDEGEFPHLVTKNAHYVSLNSLENSIDIQGKVPNPGFYIFIVQYYQPDYPEFDLDVLIQNGVFYKAKLPLKFCPSVSGCRSVIVQDTKNKQFNLIESFVVTLKESEGKNVYLDYLAVIPADLYTDQILEEIKMDRTHEFITTCGNNHFNIDTTVEGFCRESVFSITAGYNNGALMCHCNYEGSRSFYCDKFGGQCPCLPNIIGRTCEACKTGYFGFPDCKPCNCPTTAYCDPNNGECICPPRVTGENCDQCMPYTYGYDPMIGCEECKCNPIGVHDSLQCDLFYGNCTCKKNVVGNQCDMCKAGHYYFPYCESCDCNEKGTTEEICDQQSAECFCKKYVTGLTCDICREGTFNLQESNEDGCKECFCSGKTTRCTESDYVFYTLADMDDWKLVTIEEGSRNINVTPLSLELQRLTDYELEVDLRNTGQNASVYFSAPESYLGKSLTSYGGNLTYSIYYNIGTSGKATLAPDVIITGSDTYLTHLSIEQPPADIMYFTNVELVESEFLLPDGYAAKREDIMTVLKDLTGIYIRGSYWSNVTKILLSSVGIDQARNASYRGGRPALSVEECHCPPGYEGLSCEECSPGYYRVSVGPNGGYCAPCECNGHAYECDVNTGVCLDCKHNTRGDHCELCEVGYQGNARHGTPMDCLICACPIPLTSNNFATSCDVSPDGEKISCTCREGYTGGLCQSCAPGFYGRPYEIGDYCKPCECSGNINPYERDSCDTITGECLRCLNNTFGKACSLCAPGYYGDAIQLKNCQACICDKDGTDHCDSSTGECQCKPNVEGEKCDRCAIEHYGFQSGEGCSPCNCGQASTSSICEDATGQCRCKPGVTGRTCDRCAAGYWNYTADGCITCGCRTQYSLGFGCNAQTGQCECLKNVEGEKCDRCPYRWVFVPEYGCHECDTCTHHLLDTTDELSHLIDPVINEFDSKESGYFTNRRLTHINDTLQELKPLVEALDPEAVNLKPLIAELESLEQDSKNMNRKTNYSLENSKTILTEAEEIREEALKMFEEIIENTENAKITIQDIGQLSINYEIGEGPKVDLAVAQAEQILEDIKANNLTKRHNDTTDQLLKIDDLLQLILDYKGPVDDMRKDIEETKDQIRDFNDKLDDIYNHTLYTVNKANEFTYYGNSTDKLEKKLKNIENQKKDAENALEESGRMLQNASRFLKDAIEGFDKLMVMPEDFQERINIVNNTVEDNTDDINEIYELFPRIQDHADMLTEKAQELDNELTFARDTSGNAVAAAKAYANIVNAIKEAEEAAESAKEYVDNAASVLTGIEDDAIHSEQTSATFLDDAYSTFQKIENLEHKLEEVSRSGRPIRSLHEKNVEQLDTLEKKLQQPLSRPFNEILEEAKENADTAEVFTKETANGIQDAFNLVSEEMEQAKEMPKKLDDAKKDLVQVEKQLNTVNDKLPEIIKAINELPDRQNEKREIAMGLEEKIKKLKEQIAIARDIAGQIKVGGKFYHNTTLELRNPPNLPDLSTSTYISGYFKTPQRNGMIYYLGNPEGAQVRGKTNDYMALEILNGYPVLTLDIGNGVEQVRSPQYVADDRWYKFVVDRTGLNAELKIIEELQNGTGKAIGEMQTLDGPFSIFNLDRNYSKLCVGSCPEDVQLQSEIQQTSFEGEIEDLIIGDTPISLWNFNQAENTYGAMERDKFINLKPSTGYRFNGDGYVILNARSYSLRHRYAIELIFKTFSPQGLIFLYGKGNPSFVALEMRNGKILYKYNLGDETMTWYTKETFNDGEWHKIQVFRDSNLSKFMVDGIQINNYDKNVRGTTIEPSETLVIGGYPSHHGIKDITEIDFDGCIDNVTISGTNVDLSQNIKAYDVTPGCPAKIARLITFPGHISKHNISIQNDFRLMLKFKTKENDGLLFYATNKDQSSGISLALSNGTLKFISQKLEIVSDDNNFNDSEWHVVSVTHSDERLILSYDDYAIKRSDAAPPDLRIWYGQLFVGSLPRGYEVKAGAVGSSKAFNGCIGDATLNDNVMNFAHYSDLHGGVLGKCQLDSKIGSETDVHQVPVLPPIPEFEPVGTTESEGIEHYDPEQDKPTRGDGGSDTGGRPPESEETEETTLKPAQACALPMIPNKESGQIEGYKFGSNGKESRVEYPNGRGKFTGGYDFSLDFKTTSPNGILIYLSGKTDNQFKSMYMHEGHIIYAFNNNGATAILKSPGTYNDDSWHRVIFSRIGPHAKLVVNDEVVAESGGHSVNNPHIKAPYYLGGVDPIMKDIVEGNLNLSTQFSGCINNFRMNNRTMENPNTYNTLPCSDSIESGVFFSHQPGFIKLKEKFRVGKEIDIKLEIKPRNISGLLISVHGKKDYLILEMVNGSIRFTVDNGRGPIYTLYHNSNPYYFCDGKWHSIQAVKSKSVVTLSVDQVFTQPTVGDVRAISTDTTGSLFLGGHRLLGRLKGHITKTHFVGCIKNLEINNQPIEILPSMKNGPVTLDYCPKN